MIVRNGGCAIRTSCRRRPTPAPAWEEVGRARCAESREQAEQRLKALGYEWQWLDDGCLRATTPRLPAVRELADGRRTFFNQLIAAYHGWRDTRNDPSKAITHGDGSPLNAEAVATVARMADELTFDVPWQTGTWRWSTISSRCTAGVRSAARGACWRRWWRSIRRLALDGRRRTP